jgi:hypothetical protein
MSMQSTKQRLDIGHILIFCKIIYGMIKMFVLEFLNNLWQPLKTIHGQHT